MRELTTKVLLTIITFLPIIECNVIAQPEGDEYVVISFERKRLKNVRTFYWIVPSSNLSLNHNSYSYKNCIFPLCFGSVYPKDSFSDEWLEKKNYPENENIPIQDGSMYSNFNGEDWDLSEEYDHDTPAGQLLRIVKNKKRLIQKIQKEWKDNQSGLGFEDLRRHKETIAIYATPVKGEFIKCWISDMFLGKLDFAGYSYCPSSSIEYNDRFWASGTSQSIQYADYGFVYFAYYTASLLTVNNDPVKDSVFWNTQ